MGASGWTRYGAKRSASILTRRSVRPSQCACTPSPRQDTMPMPVIQTSRGTSAMSEGPDGEREDRRHLLHAGPELGAGKLNQPERDRGVRGELAAGPER